MPTTNALELYPIGHPEILLGNQILEKFPDLESAVTNEDLFGLLYCELYPPKKILHPVIGMNTNGKLVFPLCRTCAAEENQNSCNHSEQDRKITGNFVSVEVKAALAQGYKLGRAFEVWNWHRDQRSSTLFRDFIFSNYLQKATSFPCFLSQTQS